MLRGSSPTVSHGKGEGESWWLMHVGANVVPVKISTDFFSVQNCLASNLSAWFPVIVDIRKELTKFSNAQVKYAQVKYTSRNKNTLAHL